MIRVMSHNGEIRYLLSRTLNYVKSVSTVSHHSLPGFKLTWDINVAQPSMTSELMTHHIILSKHRHPREDYSHTSNHSPESH